MKITRPIYVAYRFSYLTIYSLPLFLVCGIYISFLTVTYILWNKKKLIRNNTLVTVYFKCTVSVLPNFAQLIGSTLTCSSIVFKISSFEYFSHVIKFGNYRKTRHIFSFSLLMVLRCFGCVKN